MDQKLGATGEFPDGQLNKDDEGELQFAIAADHDNKVVVVDFGKSVAWLGLPPNTAKELAEVLIKKANELLV